MYSLKSVAHPRSSRIARVPEDALAGDVLALIFSGNDDSLDIVLGLRHKLAERGEAGRGVDGDVGRHGPSDDKK